MNDLHKEILRVNRIFLVQNIIFEALEDYLIQTDLFSGEMLQNMKAEATTSNRNRQLLNDLPRRGPRAFPLFVQCLEESDQRHVAKMLKDSERELLNKAQPSRSSNLSHGEPPPTVPASAPRSATSFGVQPTSDPRAPYVHPMQPTQVNSSLLNYGPHTYSSGPQPMDTSQRARTPPPMQASSDDQAAPSFDIPDRNQPHSTAPFHVTVTATAQPVPQPMSVPKPSINPQHIYDMGGRIKGRALVINNHNFRVGWLTERKGYENDTKMLTRLFKFLGFEFVMKENLTGRNMQEEIKRFVEDDRTHHCSSTMLVVMSHGGTGTVYGSDGQKVQILEDMVYRFHRDNAPHLRDKPKLFIIQACRGGSSDPGYGRQTVDGGAVHSENQSESTVDGNPRTGTDTVDSSRRKRALLQDMLIANSTIRGYVAFRHTEQGSWFIQAVCDVFHKLSHKEHVMDMFVKVNEKVTQWDADNVQLPSPECLLTKKWYLFPELL